MRLKLLKALLFTLAGFVFISLNTLMPCSAQISSTYSPSEIFIPIQPLAEIIQSYILSDPSRDSCKDEELQILENHVNYYAEKGSISKEKGQKLTDILTAFEERCKKAGYPTD